MWDKADYEESVHPGASWAVEPAAVGVEVAVAVVVVVNTTCSSGACMMSPYLSFQPKNQTNRLADTTQQ